MPSPDQMQAGDVGYYLVRSMDRLKNLVLEPMTNEDDKVKVIKERAAFVDWHDQLVRAAQELGMLPKVVFTPRTEIGRKYGAG